MFSASPKKTDALNQMIEEYRKIEKIDSAALEKYGTYLRAAVDMIQYCTQASTLPVIKDHTEIPDLDSLFNRYFQIAYSTSDLLTDISKKIIRQLSTISCAFTIWFA
jgi:hypothetical protein